MVKYECNACNKEFTTNYGLNKHINKKIPCILPNQSKTSRFNCNECNHSFTTNQSLKIHIKNTCQIIKNREKKDIENIAMQTQIDKLTDTVNELKLALNAQKTEIIYVPKIIESTDITTGIIYLIQPEELLKTNRYKIGCSTKSGLSRIYAYKKNSRYLYIAECINPSILETNIKNAFNNKYTLIAGKEYFEGDEKNIVNDFIKMVSDYNNETYDTNIVAANIANITINDIPNITSNDILDATKV
jgi:hypothetical protein